MEKCLHCSAPLKHIPGRKQKSFCNANCRNKYFYAQRKKQIEDARAILVSLPADYVDIKKIGVITKDGEVKPVFPKPENVCLVSPAPDNDEILKQILAIKAEKIPKERDTPFGKKAWEFDQKKRIKELENQLK